MTDQQFTYTHGEITVGDDDIITVPITGYLGAEAELVLSPRVAAILADGIRARTTATAEDTP